MATLGMPGPGGSIGQCVLCGGSFMVELMLGTSVGTVKIEGLVGDPTLCIHTRCQEKLEPLLGQPWEKLPEGPLRKIYAEAAARGDLEGGDGI